ncbi:MAG: DUF1819 family protein [Candidatus Brocadiales bacterium]|nr:DUF1819 family protein [Candidatus Brocadiales bacterium]
MKASKDISDTYGYDTAINVIGGLKDISVIFNVIESHFRYDDSVSDLVAIRNELNLRTEKSRVRVERAVVKAFLQFTGQAHEDLIRNIFQTNMPLQDKELVLYWQLALSNRLFREITINVYSKIYFSGRAGLSKEDVIAYLKDFLAQSKHLNLGWSESTIKTLSTKYLNLMTKLNFLTGSRIKSFRHIKTSTEALILFLYFARLYSPLMRNILKNEMIPLSFLLPEDIKERLKKLSVKGLFQMELPGDAVNIYLTHSFSEISHALYN